MSAENDDGGDDAQLKQLRSVWVSMRESDEEPPDRGLDALMAAARTKAADMTPPASEGFWTKVLAVFRRPPVLALASLTVLLGGALFIAQRRDTMQSEDTVADRQEQRSTSAGSASVATPPPDHGSAAASPTTPAVTAPPAPEVVEAPRPRVTNNRRPGAAASPALEKQAEAKAEPSKGKAVKADEGGEDDVIAKPTTITTESESAGGLTQVAPTAQSGLTRGPVAKAPEAAPANDAYGRGEAKPAMDEADARASTDRGAKDAPLTQLVKQCESAAARNDCAVVRVLAKKIKAADAAAYQQRVAKNTAIARCLE